MDTRITVVVVILAMAFGIAHCIRVEVSAKKLILK